GLGRLRIEVRGEEPTVGGQDSEQREWHDCAEQEAADEKPAVAGAPPGAYCRQEADDTKRGLHDRGPAIARREFPQCEGGATGEPGRVLDRRDVDGRAGEVPGADRCDDLESHEGTWHRIELV